MVNKTQLNYDKCYNCKENEDINKLQWVKWGGECLFQPDHDVKSQFSLKITKKVEEILCCQ